MAFASSGERGNVPPVYTGIGRGREGVERFVCWEAVGVEDSGSGVAFKDVDLASWGGGREDSDACEEGEVVHCVKI